MIWIQTNDLHKVLARLFTLLLGKIKLAQPVKRIGRSLTIRIVGNKLLETLGWTDRTRARACIRWLARKPLARSKFRQASLPAPLPRHQWLPFVVQAEVGPRLMPLAAYQDLDIDLVDLFAAVAPGIVAPLTAL